ncbi:matrix metalloproteinase-2-like [Aricia agestis]|uniref:matrix metalloproteinase-2-like n=1 Tax=Aricia agestis TaxID=91739 RepID=UPI001C205DAA|nr:matrix metalloproteinase-2-like [Aricia agestis]
MLSRCLCLLVCLHYFGVVNTETIFVVDPIPTEDERRFMQQYGYLWEDGGGAVYTAASLAEAVRRVQRFAGLPPTGLMDPQTRRLFKSRRCGVKDIESAEERSRRLRRYILQEGWKKRSITYRVLNGSRTLDAARAEALFAAGLAVWAAPSGLTFSRADPAAPRADIQLSFASRDHGDGFPFDGAGRVVAHAFPPPHGAMHFDDDETWGDGSAADDDDDVTDFFAVAVHEIGHALGLSHSGVRASVMYPYYQVPVQHLHDDDIQGLRALYSNLPSTELSVAEPHTASSYAPPFTRADAGAERDEGAGRDAGAGRDVGADTGEEYEEEEDIPDLCFTNYDTLQVIQGKIYVFEEEWVWVLEGRKRVAAGYPRRWRELFPGLPRHVTQVRAIYEKRDGHIVLFNKRNFWEYSAEFRLVRRGRLTEYRLPRTVAELTSAFVSNYNNRTYLLEDERYWRLDDGLDRVDGGHVNARRAYAGRMDPGYPRDMSAWRDVPYPVDAALVWEGDTFFFRGPRFWRFDNTLVRAHAYYPQPTAPVWFPCATTQDMIAYLTNDDR